MLNKEDFEGLGWECIHWSRPFEGDPEFEQKLGEFEKGEVKILYREGPGGEGICYFEYPSPYARSGIDSFAAVPDTKEELELLMRLIRFWSKEQLVEP